MGAGQSKPSAQPSAQPSAAIQWANTIGKVIVLAIVAFLVYEAIKFGGSGAGKALGKIFGAIAGFAQWLAGHPNTIVAAVFSAIFVPLAGIIAGGTFKLFQARIEMTKQLRENEAKAREALTKYYEQKFPNKSEAERSRMVENGLEGGAADVINEKSTQIREQGQIGGEPLNQQEQQQNNDAIVASEGVVDDARDDAEEDGDENGEGVDVAAEGFGGE